ncbi:MAG: uroporphyrinogen decarboxylase family protein, partial [Bacillota bacterium]
MLLDVIRRNRQVIEENRRRIEDTWAYRPVDHIPFVVMLEENPGGYSLHDRIKDPVKQLEFCKASVLKTVERVPYDYIPFLLPEVGNIIIPTAFGAKVTFPDNPEELPIVEKPIIERIEDVYELKIPDPHTDGLMPEALDRVRYFARETGFEIPLALVNVQGPMNTAFKLMDSSTFYFALYDNPEAVTYVLRLLAETYIAFVNALIEAAGGTANITSTNHHPVWCPPGRKAYICDDMAATISPRDFVRFNRVANSYIYHQFGGGLIHNCGPHPSVDVYLDHTPGLAGLTTSWTY